MIDFMADDMKPLEVIVHALAIPKGRLLFEPAVIALAKFRKCLRTNLCQPAQVMIQRVSSDLISCRLAKIDRGTPLRSLNGGEITRIERRRLIAGFSGRNV